MNPCELTASITVIANSLSTKLSTAQLNLLGVTLTQLADTLLTIAAQRELCCNAAEPRSPQPSTIPNR